MSITALAEPLPKRLPNPEECYRRVEQMIDAIVTRFVSRYGGDYKELRADADTHWWAGDQAYRNRKTNGRAIDPDYRVEIRRWVHFCLFDEYRIRAQHRRQDENKLVVECDEYINERPTEVPEFPLAEFMDELSEDARTVIGLLLDVPAEATLLWRLPNGTLYPAGAAVAHVAAAKGGQGRNWRSTLRQCLADMGWTVAQINKAFDEIREALV